VEKVIEYLLEMSKIIDEVELDLNRVAVRLNSLRVTMRENIDDDKVADIFDEFSSRID